MTVMRVKLIHGPIGELEAGINDWLESNPEAEVRDIKITSGAGSTATALITFFQPKQPKRLGFGHQE